MPITTIVPVSPIVNIDVSAASKVIVLPAASTCIGATFILKDYKGAASTYNIFVSTNGLDRVDGQSLSSIQLRLTSTLETLKVMSLGNTNWSVAQRNKIIPSILSATSSPYIYSIFIVPSFVTGLSSIIYLYWRAPAIGPSNVLSYLVNDIAASSSSSVTNTTTSYTVTKTTTATYQFTVSAVTSSGSIVSNTASIVFTVAAAQVLTARSITGSHLWFNVAISSNGTKLFAADINSYIYTSSDSGVTWTQQTGSGSPPSPSYVICSSDGTKLVATDGSFIYTSSNSGVTWTQQTGTGTSAMLSSTPSYIAGSSDLTKIAVATTNDYIYTSSNSGVTWTQQTGSPASGWSAIASSSDGSILVGGSYDTYLYTSTNSGVSWVQRISHPGSFSASFTSITCSSNGLIIYAFSQGDRNVCLSTDGGATWSTILNTNGCRLSCSSDGTQLVAVQSTSSGTNTVYVSINSGTSFQSYSLTSVNNYISAAMSGDGTNIVICKLSTIYTLPNSSSSGLLPFMPSSVTGLTIQCDAYNLSSSDGTVLTTWTNNGSGGTVNCTGTVNTNILNSQRVVTFSTSATWGPATNVSLYSYSMFFVGRQTGGTNCRVLQDSTTNQLFGYWNGYKKALFIDGDPQDHVTGISSDTSWDMFSHTRVASGAFTFNWNGTLLYSASSSTSSVLRNPVINQGYASGESSDCQVAEILIYNSVLTSAQVAKVEGYLAWKWGLVANLPSDHPYKNSYPTV
jgi:hypothetical protein